MCVDDEPPILASLRRLLRREPYELLTTARPRTAINWMAQRSVSVLIADQRMPEMTGTELLQIAHERFPATCLVMLTAYPDRDVFDACVRARTRHLITKPWDDDGLRRTIRELCRDAELERGTRTEAAVRRFVNRDWRRLFQLASTMLHDPLAAEDIAQETMARVIEHMGDFRGQDDLFAWSYTIALNLCRAKVKADRLAPATLDPLLLDRAGARPAEAPSARLMLEETYQRAVRAVASLPDALREAFTRHYVDGMAYRAVGHLCGISEGAARLRAMRARQLLQRQLSPLLEPEVAHRRTAG